MRLLYHLRTIRTLIRLWIDKRTRRKTWKNAHIYMLSMYLPQAMSDLEREINIRGIDK